MTDALPHADGRPRFAARVDDWVHRRREKGAKRRSKTPGVIPYIGYGGAGWVRVLGRVLYLRPEADAKPKPRPKRSLLRRRQRPDVAQVSRVRGWRSFTSLHAPYQRVRVSIDGEHVTEIVSDRGGVIDSIVRVSLAPGWHTVSLQTDTGDPVEAPVYVVDPAARFGVISDVDDTILNTALPKPLVAAWNSFVVDEHARTSTPGMPVLYDHLAAAHPGAPVIYLSTGAWNVAPALSRFLERNLYPMGPLLLTDWGPTHDRWFRSGKEHKLRELDRLAREFPDVRWVLFGDDGQHDEFLYQEFAQQHPGSVAAVAIRQLSTGQAVLAGGRSKAGMHRKANGVPWVYGSDGATLREELRGLGLL
jgi:phosphatidate phosphatase APP1